MNYPNYQNYSAYPPTVVVHHVMQPSGTPPPLLAQPPPAYNCAVGSQRIPSPSATPAKKTNAAQFRNKSRPKSTSRAAAFRAAMKPQAPKIAEGDTDASATPQPARLCLTTSKAINKFHRNMHATFKLFVDFIDNGIVKCVTEDRQQVLLLGATETMLGRLDPKVVYEFKQMKCVARTSELTTENVHVDFEFLPCSTFTEVPDTRRISLNCLSPFFIGKKVRVNGYIVQAPEVSGQSELLTLESEGEQLQVRFTGRSGLVRRLQIGDAFDFIGVLEEPMSGNGFELTVDSAENILTPWGVI